MTIGDAAGFTGHFNGNGHTLTYEVDGTANKSGLFHTLNGARVWNLKTNVVQRGENTDAARGALVMRAQNSVIENVSVAHRLAEGTRRAAGIAGEADSNTLISGCSVALAGTNGEYSYYAGIVYNFSGRAESCRFALGAGSGKLGNFAGIAYLSNGKIEACSVDFAEGYAAVDTVTGQNATGGVVYTEEGGMVGGVAAKVLGGLISDCYVRFNLTVDGKGLHLAGIAARVDGSCTVQDCTVTGNMLRGYAYAGGLAGLIDKTATGPVVFSGCEVRLGSLGASADTSISASGGLIGLVYLATDLTIVNCASYANIYGGGNLGGLVGIVFYQSGATAEKPYRFTMGNTHCYADELVGKDTSKGGAIGAMGGRYDNISTFIYDCTTWTKVRGGSYNAGFAAQLDLREPAKKDANRPATFLNCHAYGDVSVQPHPNWAASLSGGFAGFVYYGSRYLTFQDCSAYGNVIGTTGTTNLGGFVGSDYMQTDYEGQDSSVRHTKGSEYIDCRAYGDVVGLDNIGGFIGVTDGLDNRFEGCEARGNVTASGSAAGGFAGRSTKANTYENCSAYGNVTANRHVGGFTGAIAEIESADAAVYRNCIAGGNVVGKATVDDAANTTRGVGGFLGRSQIAGMLRVEKCEAYGDATGVGTAGFVGYILQGGNYGFKSCSSYGNTYCSNAGIGTSGFATLLADGSASFIECANYGTVVNPSGINVNFVNTGRVTEITDCASYAKLAQGHEFSASFVRVGSGNVTARGCIYRSFAGKDVFVSYAGGGKLVTDSARPNKYLADNASAPPNPKNFINVTRNGSTFRVDFSGATGYSVKSLAVSTDGVFQTYLVYRGVALIPGITPVTAGTNPLACYSFNCTYPYLTASSFTVTITIAENGGTGTITKVFRL